MLSFGQIGMVESGIKRVLVWSGWLRLSHAATGLSTLVLLLTGWLIAESPSLAAGASEAHFIAAGVFIAGLLIRTALFFIGNETERLHSLVPQRRELDAMVQTLRFYLAFGRTALPGWYAHNPLWKPAYLLVFAAMFLLALSGALMPETDLLFGFYLPSVHAWWAELVLWFTGLHIASVVWHDLKSRSTDVSGIINGYRTFETGGNAAAPQVDAIVDVESIRRDR